MVSLFPVPGGYNTAFGEGTYISRLHPKHGARRIVKDCWNHDIGDDEVPDRIKFVICITEWPELQKEPTKIKARDDTFLLKDEDINLEDYAKWCFGEFKE